MNDRERLYLTPKELSIRWKKSLQTLANNRALKKGISYTLLNGQVRYDMNDIEEYEKKNKVII